MHLVAQKKSQITLQLTWNKRTQLNILFSLIREQQRSDNIHFFSTTRSYKCIYVYIFPKDEARICFLKSKENRFIKENKIGGYDDRECHLFCDFNFHEFPKKPVLLVYAFDKLLRVTGYVQSSFLLKSWIRWHYLSSF